MIGVNQMEIQARIKKTIINATMIAEKLESLVSPSLSEDDLSAISEMNNKLIVIMTDISILNDATEANEDEINRLADLCDQLYFVVSDL
jgi:predicted ATPase